MTSSRHFTWFMLLGLFWGVSPSVYKHLATIGMPVTHTIFWTGLGVGLIMLGVSLWRDGLRLPRRDVAIYGAGCAFLMNIPFGINLFLAGHVPPTELAIIITLSPFCNYLLALFTGVESATPRRLIAIVFGFLSTLVLILSREGTLSGQISWWLIASLSIPLLYMAYNAYAAQYFPKNADTWSLGAMESLFSALWILPLLLVIDWPGQPQHPSLAQHWILLAVTMMWVVERVAYFILIRAKGAVYTVQATYVSTPVAVIISALLFGGVTDTWLWISLILLMVALWLNNTGAVTRSVQPLPAPQGP
jgi:drug/metabolite transporter (DMT)-like permease